MWFKKKIAVVLCIHGKFDAHLSGFEDIE